MPGRHEHVHVGGAVAAVTNAGGLGSLGAANRPVDDLRRQLARIADLTAGSFAVNHLVTVIDEEAFALTLDAHPRVISMALDHPHDYVKRAHDAGALVMHQVTTVQQALDAAERGVDLIIAQGGEAGGYGGTVATMTLVPQVVDAVRPLPVIAAGGITDGRGMAAALMLGAQGVDAGTPLLATDRVADRRRPQAAIVERQSEDAIKADVWNDINPLPGDAGYFTVVRARRTPFIDETAGAPRGRATTSASEIQARVDAERAVRRRAHGVDLLAQDPAPAPVDAADRARTAGYGDGRRQRCERRAAGHAGVADRDLDAEQVADGSVEGHVLLRCGASA